mmetsp:Transcript_23637/g.27331  ORF Transcript_23637/g.27331 Transcript_23637/m.27331 type:complete len:628 (-) Transcript_23637:368-2251(-)
MMHNRFVETNDSNLRARNGMLNDDAVAEDEMALDGHHDRFDDDDMNNNSNIDVEIDMDEEIEACDEYLRSSGKTSPNHYYNFRDEFVASFVLMKGTKLNTLLIFAPLAFWGSYTASFGDFTEFICFCSAGLALIPCAERLSFVTEHVAEHTNETIGALLNATFGNAPEFLISSAALRNGFYRVVQLTLLGSILTNLLFVFGLSCLIGGMQWQIQELRITSGNVSIGMLLAATIGIVLPAALKLANESISSISAANGGNDDGALNHSTITDEDGISPSDIAFSRCNAIVMVIGYCCYLMFQLGSHKDEFDYTGDELAPFGGGHNIVRVSAEQYQSVKKKKHAVRRNHFCKKYCFLMKYCPDVEKQQHTPLSQNLYEDTMFTSEDTQYLQNDITTTTTTNATILRRNAPQSLEMRTMKNGITDNSSKSMSVEQYEMPERQDSNLKTKTSDYGDEEGEESVVHEIMTMRMGLLWLGVVTATISLVSGIIVDTIDGFAARSNMSEVFTSVIIIPYFSNIAEQVSAVIFAYRNKMDLCIGVSVGSAIQIAQFVMPGCVLVAWVMGRSMTLYFRAYETLCLFLGVICVAGILQGGTTNWLVGVFFIGIYLMIAAGFCYHENEDLSTDEELDFQ